MKKILLSTALCATMMFAANSEYKYEITPMLGGTITEGNLDLERNYADIGLSLGFNLDDSMFDQIEIGFLRSLGDVDYKRGSNDDTGITRFFTNVVKDYPLTNKSSIYGLVGAGVEWFDNEKYENESGLFANYGVGYKYKLDNGMAFKFDLRHLIETDHGDNNLLYTVGFAIPFGKKASAAPMKPMMKKEPAMAVKDHDNDGVIDSLDLCPNSPAESIVNDKGCAILVDLKINFDTDSSVVKSQYDTKITNFANYLKENKDVTANIEAHTDSTASNAYNQKLSERRAASTIEALKAQDIKESRLSAFGFGETKPLSTNTTTDGRADNRRVHAIINR